MEVLFFFRGHVNTNEAFHVRDIALGPVGRRRAADVEAVVGEFPFGAGVLEAAGCYQRERCDGYDELILAHDVSY